MSYTNPFPDLPSASRIERIHHCPASLHMERAAPKRIEDTTDADLGNEIHAILAGEESEGEASASAAQTAEMCDEQTDRLLADWLISGETYAVQGYREVRYGLTTLGNVAIVHADSRADFIFTGQFDRLYVQGDRGLLIDFKALHGEHTNALYNPQLASLAVLVARRHILTFVRVALVQPWKGKPTVADYSMAALAQANGWLVETLQNATVATPDDRKAGKHCKYCKARFACQTFKNANIYALDIVQPETLPANPATRNKAVFARMAEMTPQQLIHIEEYVVGLMGVFIAAHKAVFKQAVENGEIPGYTTREKKGRRSISDVATVFSRAAAQGVTAEAFTAECSIALGALNTLLKTATGAKGKALEAIAAEVLRDATDTSKGSTEVVKLTLE